MSTRTVSLFYNMKQQKLPWVTACISLALCFAVLSSCSKGGTDRPMYNPPPAVAGKTYSADEIAGFKQLTINSTMRIMKLPKRVSVYLVDTAYGYITTEIDSIISEINTLLDTNLVLTRTADRNAATIKIYLTDRNTYKQAEPQAASTLENSTYTGLAYLNWNDFYNIYHVSVFLDMVTTAKDTLQQRYLIHHEMMHALGFYAHVNLPQIYTVLFSYTLTPYVLNYTLFDRRMMLLLYHPSIKANMNETEFNEAIKNI